MLQVWACEEQVYICVGMEHVYPRVTSFDALKQSTDICADLITFSGRKYIILNKLSCFQLNYTFWEVREHLFLFKISLSTSVRVPPLFILADTSFDAFHWLLKKTIFFHCSPVFTWCTLCSTRKIISSS